MILQIASVSFILQSIWLMYWVTVRPTKDFNKFRVELVNEVVFTIMLHLLPVYAAMSYDQEKAYELGWIFIVIYIGLFIFNVLVILVPVIKGLMKLCAKNGLTCKQKIQKSPRYLKAKAKVDACKELC